MINKSGQKSVDCTSGSALTVGAALMPIVPKLGVDIPGYFGGRPAQGFLDELDCEAVVFSLGNETVIMISIDIIDFRADFVRSLRAKLTAETGVDGTHILVAATHTHTGSPSDYDIFGSKSDNDTVEYIIKTASECAKKAYDSRRPATLRFGRQNETRISFNRNYYMKDGTLRTNPGIGNPEIKASVGKIDPELDAIFAYDESGSPFAVIVNFACHPDTVSGDLYSADYPGVMRRELMNMYPGAIPLFFNGCAGDINHLNALGGIPPIKEHHKMMGKLLAEDVAEAEKNAENVNVTSIGAVNEVRYVKRRQPTAEDIENAKKVVNNPEADVIELTFARETLQLAENPIAEEETELIALRIGEIGIAGLPCEAYSEIGFEIKRRSEYKYTLAFELTCGTVGYVPTPECFVPGIYEARLSVYNSVMPKSTSKDFANTAIRLLKGLQ